MPQQNECRVIALHAENVKRLVAVDIRPAGNTITLTGKNGAGKSSVLDAIAYALGGAALLPEEPVRRGAAHAVVRVDLGTLRVERKWTNNGSSTLTITAADGTKCKTPQAILDSLVGQFTFNPTEFSRMKAKAQADVLLRLLGIGEKLEQLKARHDNLYCERTDSGRELKQAEAAVAVAAGPLKDPGPEVSVAALLEERRRLEASNQANAGVRAELGRLRDAAARHAAAVGAAEKDVADLENELAEARKVLGQHQRNVAEAAGAIAALTLKVKALVDADTGKLEDAILGAQERNTGARLWQERQQKAAARDAKAREVTRLTVALDQVAEEKRMLVTGATFPVPGLTADLDGVYLNGVPFAQGSQAQQLTASLEVGWALNSALKVMMLRDASLLDDESLALVRASAESHGGQLWLERVKAEEGEAAILIEDGLVASAPAGAGDIALGRAALESR